MSAAKVSGQRIRRSTPIEIAARIGLFAHATVYLTIGALILVVAYGDRHPETDQRGALQAISAQTGGAALILLVGIGLAGYALWRFAEAVLGAAGEGNRVFPRVQSLFGAILYSFLAGTAFTVALGRHRSQADQSRALSARVMMHSGGRLLVGAVGLVILIISLVLISQGVRGTFAKYLRHDRIDPRARRVLIAVGVIGTIARGAMFALVGVLIMDAAVRFDASDSTGIDAAIRTLAQQPFGDALLVVTGIGLIAFSVFGFAEARWRIT